MICSVELKLILAKPDDNFWSGQTFSLNWQLFPENYTNKVANLACPF